MSDFIKREDAIEVAYQLRHKPNDDEWNWWLRSFNAIPTIDAVEVVRCKECKWRKACKVFSQQQITDDSYCSWGESAVRR